jgi:hypothetical protein
MNDLERLASRLGRDEHIATILVRPSEITAALKRIAELEAEVQTPRLNAQAQRIAGLKVMLARVTDSHDEAWGIIRSLTPSLQSFLSMFGSEETKANKLIAEARGLLEGSE